MAGRIQRGREKEAGHPWWRGIGRSTTRGNGLGRSVMAPPTPLIPGRRPQVGQAIHGSPTVVGLVRRCSRRKPTFTRGNTDRPRELHKKACNYNIIVIIIIIVMIKIIVIIKVIVVEIIWGGWLPPTLILAAREMFLRIRNIKR